MDPLRADASSLKTASAKTDHMPPRDTHLSGGCHRVRRPPETTAPSMANCVLDLGMQGPRSSPCNEVPTKLVPPFPLSQWDCPTMAKMVPGSPRFPRVLCPRLGKDALQTTYLTSRWVRTAKMAERVGGSLNTTQVSLREGKAPIRRKGAVGARVSHPVYALEENYLSPQVRASLVAKRSIYQFCPGAPSSDQPVNSTTWLPSQAPDNLQPGDIPPAAGYCNTTTTTTTTPTRVELKILNYYHVLTRSKLLLTLLMCNFYFASRYNAAAAAAAAAASIFFG